MYYLVARWKLREFGFTVNTRVILFVFLSLVVGTYFFVKGITDTGTWGYSLIEAFARTGEKLYFRGFTYVLVLKLVKHKKNWLWAVILSSLAFTLVHTQVLLPEYRTSFSQVFITALFLAYVRHITDSLLPGVTIHCFLKGGPSSVLFGWTIYALFVSVSYFKDEKGSSSVR